jgi:sugar-specific transcriptional regulator TrmB
MKIEQVLKELDLVDKEPDVYLELVRLSGAQPASVIAQRLKLNRTTVYKTLIKLSKAGLVTKTMKRGITCFIAEDPDKNLEVLLLKKKKNLDFVTQLFTEALPELKEMRKEEMLTPKMRYYEGVEGVKRVYEDTLVENKTIYSFENVEHMSFEIHDYLWNDYVPRRVEKEIFAYVITPKTSSHIKFRKNDKKSNRQTKFIGLENFPMEIEINIYGKKTSFFSYKHDEMFGVILESDTIANSMRAIFNLCWKIAT